MENTKIIIIVLGGVVQGAYSNDKTLDVKVCDWDEGACDKDVEKECKRLLKETKKMIAVY
jgi:hypothetical protein